MHEIRVIEIPDDAEKFYSEEFYRKLASEDADKVAASLKCRLAKLN